MCHIEWDDFEPTTFFKETEIKCAAKNHTCSCCRRTIKKGESYLKQASVMDGRCITEKLCPECKAVSEKFREEHDGVTNPSYLPELIKICVEQESYEGNMKNAERWNSELAAMAERRGKSAQQRDG